MDSTNEPPVRIGDRAVWVENGEEMVGTVEGDPVKTQIGWIVPVRVVATWMVMAEQLEKNA